MKKIGLYLVASPDDGGTFQHNQSVLEAVASLPTDRYEVVVGYELPVWRNYISKHNLSSFSVRKTLFSRVLQRMWRVLALPISVWRLLAPYFHSTVKAIVRERCDLWIFPTQDPLSFFAPVPALGTILDMMHRYEPSFPEVSANGIYEQREYTGKELCKWSKGVLVDSKLGRQMVSESYGIPIEKTYALPCIPPKYIYENKMPSDFDIKYKLPQKYLFYPAQFWMHKNHLRLLKAVAKVKKEFPDICLVLVGGKKNGYDDAVNIMKELGMANNVFFMGYVPDSDMAEFYRRARALVMPTFFGPTNIPQLEAFYLGCPVATSNIYGIQAQVGDAALLFDPKSVEEIADSIKNLWSDDDLCELLVVRGKKKASEWGQAQFNVVFQGILDEVLARIENK